MNLGHTPYLEHANQEISWCPMDTLKLFVENMSRKEKKFLLMEYNWIDSHFTYKFNSHGFRCQEFSSEPSVVFLGCSMTMGIGLPIEKVWATIVADRLGLACYNLAIAGSSNDTAFRLAYYWLDKLKPKIVIYNQTFAHRLETFHVTRFESGTQNEYVDFQKEWITDDWNGLLNRSKNRFGVNHLCNQLGIKFICTEVEQMKTVDLARDLGHPGIKTNKNFAETVLSMI